jgi:putative membrane protein
MSEHTAARSKRAESERSSDRVPALCLAVFAVIWIALAIRPRYRADWVLENLLTFVAVPVAVLTYRRFRFSDRAYLQATIFLVLNTVGSHYTYSEVPIGDWIRDAFALPRNHYDRLVHFCFGLLMLRPLGELFLRGAAPLSAWRRFALGLGLVALGSISYELLEWAVASVADPAAGQAYLGTQGDEWDAQKDMALALLGGIIALQLEKTGPSHRD